MILYTIWYIFKIQRLGFKFLVYVNVTDLISKVFHLEDLPGYLVYIIYLYCDYMFILPNMISYKLHMHD